MTKAINGRKSTKSLMSMIMALLVILVLFIPAYATWYIDSRTTTQILAVQGQYENGTVIHPYEPVSQTHVASMFLGEIKTGESSNNDSFYLKHQGVDYIHYSNFVTYLGDGNYSVTPNYTIHTTPFQWRQIGIPLNITNFEWGEYDFIRITTNDEHTARYIRYKSPFGAGSLTSAWQMTSDTEGLFINTLGHKSSMRQLPDEKLYVYWGANNPTGLDDTDVTFTFKIEGFNLQGDDAFFWTDEHLYVSAIAVSFTILLFGFIMTTDYIDFKIDRKRKK